MLDSEIIDEINDRHLNVKTNNMILVTDNPFNILNNINNTSNVLFTFDDFGKCISHNIKIDMSKIDVKNILNYVLDYLKSMKLIDDYNDIELKDSISLFKFEYILMNNNIILQLFFYNLDDLTTEEQMIFNELYYYNSPYFSIISFVKDNFITYFLSKNRVLDYRDNFQKYYIKSSKSHVLKKSV